MREAVIGGSGFIGGFLADQGGIAARFDSRSIAGIDGQCFDRVICAGAPGLKWRANLDPAADRAAIARLWTHLARVRAGRLVLISSVDVYPAPRGVDEADRPAPHPDAYGRHRRWLERRVAAHFPVHSIVRLPGLFGPGLRKNAVFDLLRGHETHRLPARAALQWYPLARLPADLARIEAAGLGLVNIAPEPIAMARLAAILAPGTALADRDGPRYDVGTRHAALLGGQGRYHLTAEQRAVALAEFRENF